MKNQVGISIWFLLVLFLLDTIIDEIVNSLRNSLDDFPLESIVAIAINYSLVFLVIFIIRRKSLRLSKLYFAFSIKTYSIVLVCSVVISFIINFFGNNLIQGKGFQLQPKSLISGDEILHYILSAAFEELFYRYYLLENMLLKWNKTISIMLMTLYFMGTHLMWAQSGQEFLLVAMSTGIGGLYLGLIYIKTKNLGLCFFAHLTYNLLSALFTTY